MKSRNIRTTVITSQKSVNIWRIFSIWKIQFSEVNINKKSIFTFLLPLFRNSMIIWRYWCWLWGIMADFYLLSWEDEKKYEEDEVHGGIIGRGGTLINNPVCPLIMGPVIQPLIPLYHFQCWIWCPPTPPLLAPTPPVLNTLSTTSFHPPTTGVRLWRDQWWEWWGRQFGWMEKGRREWTIWGGRKRSYCDGCWGWARRLNSLWDRNNKVEQGQKVKNQLCRVFQANGKYKLNIQNY